MEQASLLDGGSGGGSLPHSSASASSITYRVDIFSMPNAAAVEAGDEACSCLIMLVTFWFFASMTLILGLYGPVDLRLGTNTSRLLQANSIFVRDLKVKAAGEGSNGAGAVLYGFSIPPPLNVETTWSVAHNASVPPDFHKEWAYFLNQGSQLVISYTVKSPESYPMILVIAQGKDSLIQWIDDPSHPNTTLSWNLIHGSGMIHQNILQSSDYYIAMGNINQLEIEVHLHFRIYALLYNTTGAHYRCSLHEVFCVFNLYFLSESVAILTTSGTEEDGGNSERYVRLSYGPRWLAYIIGSGLMTVSILLALKICTGLQPHSGDVENQQQINGGVTTERTPLVIPNKDDDIVSLGSSYESVSHDEEDLEVCHAAATAALLKEGDIDKPDHVCMAPCDAPRDCFFLPCGHCATCFTCGTRIVDEGGTCPICHRRMKKVRKIFAV